MNMKVTILGTGTSQGVPIIGCNCDTCTSSDPKDKRLRASAFIETNGLKILIDTSIDFRSQMLRYHLDDVDIVLFTHHHVDHILGMDDLRQINQKHNKYVEVFGNEETLKEISVTFRYIFDERLIAHRAVPLVNLQTINNFPFHYRDIEIIPISVIHGYLPILGYRIGKFAYITDASHIPEEEISKLIGLDVLILNALREREHPTHFNISQAVEVATRINARRTFFHTPFT